MVNQAVLYECFLLLQALRIRLYVAEELQCAVAVDNLNGESVRVGEHGCLYGVLFGVLCDVQPLNIGVSAARAGRFRCKILAREDDTLSVRFFFLQVLYLFKSF